MLHAQFPQLWPESGAQSFLHPIGRAHGHSSLRGRLCAHTEGENGVEWTAIQSLSVIPGMMVQGQAPEGHSIKGW